MGQRNKGGQIPSDREGERFSWKGPQMDTSIQVIHPDPKNLCLFQHYDSRGLLNVKET